MQMYEKCLVYKISCEGGIEAVYSRYKLRVCQLHHSIFQLKKTLNLVLLK